jgi:hypothetical protein
MLGAVTMNTIVTFGALGAVLVVGMVATYPEMPLWPILLPALLVCIVVPVVFYPYSYTLWAAIDLTMHPLTPAEVADADAFVAASVDRQTAVEDP